MNPAHVVLDAEQIPSVAIGICRTDHGNTHTGVAYRHSDGSVHFFHQAWHHVTRDAPIAGERAAMNGPFFCVMPDVEPDRAQAIAAFWDFIASRKETIGYALRHDPHALFDPQTGRLTMATGIGLSCSTFVLVLFRSVRFPLIDTTGWPVDRPGDREAQEKLLEVLDTTCMDRTHIESVRQEIATGCERVRPEEIAGAALYDALPVQHPQAEDAGLFIRGGLCLLALLRAGSRGAPSTA
jgi:hypothetical protein